ncbi:uncharacterized protein B0I36DRAFT_293064 [Microdochium trichocladiopsis]|uniref:P-loop containing nucleoside triphosphate hydrolase protein n=1 Tax=Microdochium trichocladiopsis TaxID=1682393 RepID=A0A9P8Y2Q1_9PEZI|nr:uncharacterized protein B0I36DRAFT_293064 [Microdochium trichocladiopsis]KAH7028127.1 hypothetical protein B0I36DRAFT_293064 [Microdochium trichocladiopsis]
MDDQHVAARKVPMRVLSLGFSRTATSSMKAALEILLGAPCYHAFELYDHVDHCATWNAALDAKFSPPDQQQGSGGKLFTTQAQWDTVLAGYAAVTDVPAICFADELLAAYPDAKVVLVQRDTEKWFRSFDDNVSRHLYDFASNLVARLDRWYLGPPVSVHHRWARGWMGAGSWNEMRVVSRGFYERHYEHVREITPRSRLLEYELGSGWGPLCEFLGVEEVPDVEFPRVNESAAMDEKIKGVVSKGMLSIASHVVLYGSPVVAALAAGWWFASAQ